MAEPVEDARPWTERWAKRLFFFVVFLSLLVLLSWAAGWWEVGTFGRDYVPMAPSTALLFALTGCVGAYREGRDSSRTADLLIVVAACVLWVTSAIVFSNAWLGVETPSLMSTEQTVGGFPVGRMSPLTALAFSVTGIVIVLRIAKQPALRLTGAVLAFAIAALGFVVVLGYTLAVPILYRGDVLPMAASTAGFFIILGLGLLLSCGEDVWPLNLFVAHHEPTSQRAMTVGLLVLLIVALTLISAAGSGYVRYEMAESRRAATETVSAIADLKVDQISFWYAERLADAETISKTPVTNEMLAVRQGVTSGQEIDDISEWLRALREQYGYSSTVIVREDGTVLLGEWDGAKTIDSATLEACRTARENRRPVIGEIHRSRPDAAVFMPIAIPFVDHDVGLILLLRVEPSTQIFPVVQRWPTPSATGETLIVRRDGNDIVFLNELRHREGAALELRIPLSSVRAIPAARALQGFEGIIEGADYRGEPVVAAVKAIRGTPWILVAKIDRREIYSTFRHQMGLAFLSGVVLVLGATAGVSTLWYRKGLRSTERELETERLLRDTERNYRVLFDQAAVGVVKVDARTGGVVAANRRFLEITASPEHAVLGKPLRELIHERDKKGFERIGERLFRIEQQEASLECQVVRMDGARRWVSLTLSRLWGPREEPLHYVGVVRDVTEQRRAEEEVRTLNRELEDRVAKRTADLEAARREQEAFSYSVSHDLRGPLRGIDGWSLAILEDFGEKLDETGREYLHRVRSETQRMGRLIDDLLKLSRLGRHELLIEWVDLSEIARTVVEKLEEEEPDRQAHISVEPSLFANCDRTLIEIALTNLLENAWKFTSRCDEARIEFGSSDIDGSHPYFVRDNGAGFDMQYADKLFQPFTRLHRTSDFPGTGIGLATVQRIIERHGGTIRVEAAPQQGATFYFTLENKQ